jgi:hypothetical protein
MLRFRLTMIAYVFALLAAAMATFDGWGMAAAMAVLLFLGRRLPTPAGTHAPGVGRRFSRHCGVNRAIAAVSPKPHAARNFKN